MPLAVLLLAAPLRSALVDWNWVPTGSMKPTILEGDLVLVNKLAYGLRVPFTHISLLRWDIPKRGEIVVFDSPSDGQRLVKRVVGLPGDAIELRNDVLLVNGKTQDCSLVDPAPYRREVYEDTDPKTSREQLGSVSHLVMSLPHRPALRTFGPLVVPEGSYFMMGDSRDNSLDSRFYGAVPVKSIAGRGVRVLVSVDLNRRLLPRWGRFGSALD